MVTVFPELNRRCVANPRRPGGGLVVSLNASRGTVLAHCTQDQRSRVGTICKEGTVRSEVQVGDVGTIS